MVYNISVAEMFNFATSSYIVNSSPNLVQTKTPYLSKDQESQLDSLGLFAVNFFTFNHISFI